MRLLFAILMVIVTATPAAAAGDATSFLVDRDAVPSAPHPELAVTYSVGTKGDVGVDVRQFRLVADEALNDARGWAAGGAVAFVAKSDRPDFRLWLAAPSVVAAAAPVCDADFSCRVGDDVYINADRWRRGADSYRHRSLSEYRSYVINHEVGHWLGLDHGACHGAALPAPVMLQQSKALDGCEARVWPLPDERREVLRNLRRR